MSPTAASPKAAPTANPRMASWIDSSMLIPPRQEGPAGSPDQMCESRSAGHGPGPGFTFTTLVSGGLVDVHMPLQQGQGAALDPVHVVLAVRHPRERRARAGQGAEVECRQQRRV